MIRNVLEHIQGLEIWPVIALLLFFGAFLSIIYQLFRMDRDHLRHMEELPLEKDFNHSNNGGKLHG